MTSTEDRLRERILDARKRTGFSQRAVADRLKVASRTYARWERGESPLPLHRMEDIARALGVPADELIPDRSEALAAQVEQLQAEVNQLQGLVHGIFDALVGRDASSR